MAESKSTGGGIGGGGFRLLGFIGGGFCKPFEQPARGRCWAIQ